MSAPVQKAVEMNTENQETSKSDETQTAQNGEAVSAENTDSAESTLNELELPRWSIVTFEDVAVRGLSYEEAVKWMEKLEKQNISGLCIVTDEAAARISK